MTHTLYRFYNAAGDLLYIGRTVSPGDRFQQHRATKPWWKDIARITLEHFHDAATLALAERWAIWLQRPRYNISENDGPLLPYDHDAYADGCAEHTDPERCGAPITHVGSPHFRGGIFVCHAHARYYTIAIPITPPR